MTHPTHNGTAVGVTDSPPAHVVPDTARRAGGSYGFRQSLPVELGNSDTVLPTPVGRENASVRDGGRRRRRSQMPRGHGADRVKVRQGTPVKKGSKRMQRGKQMTVLRDWCASPSATTHLPFRSPQANRKAECGESRPLRLEGGKDCKVLPILIAQFNMYRSTSYGISSA